MPETTRTIHALISKRTYADWLAQMHRAEVSWQSLSELAERWFVGVGRSAQRLSVPSVHLLLWLWLSGAHTAQAAPPPGDSARTLAYAGIEAYAVADYATANEMLERAFQLRPMPSFGLWSARSLVKLGRLVEAEQRYRVVLSLEVAPSESPVQHNAKVEAAGEFAELLPRIPSLVIKLRGATFDEVQFELDGAFVSVQGPRQPLRVDPGRHVVLGTRGGDKSVQLITLAEGETEDVWLQFPELSGEAPSKPFQTGGDAREELPADPSRSLRVAGWITLGVGGAGALTGVLAHLFASGERATVDARADCSAPSCYADTVAAYDSYSTWRTVRLAALLSGGLASAAGVTLLIAGQEASEPRGASNTTELALRIGPGAAWLHVSF